MKQKIEALIEEETIRLASHRGEIGDGDPVMNTLILGAAAARDALRQRDLEELQ